MFFTLTIFSGNLLFSERRSKKKRQVRALEMDFQHRAGSKTGGGYTGSAESSRDKKERLRRLAMETIDLAKVGGCS